MGRPGRGGDPGAGRPRRRPLPGREGLWGLITHYRVLLAEEVRDWTTAEWLQRRSVDWQRRQAAPLLERSEAGLCGAERNRLRNLSVSIEELGHIQGSLEQPACVQSYQESLELSEKIGEDAGVATCAFNLGHVYWGVKGVGVPALRDLEQAEQWYRRSLELTSKEDQQGRGGCEAQLGAMAWERFQEAMAAKQPSEAETQVESALRHYHQALELLPADAVNDLAVTHNQLGQIYKGIGQLEPALRHYQEAIRISDEGGDHYGERAQQDIDQTQALIEHIEQAGNS